MPENKILISLEIDDKGTVKLKQFSDETQKVLNETNDAAKKTTSGLDELKNGWLAVTAKITLATAAFYAGKRMIYDTARDIAAQTMEIERNSRTLGMMTDEYQRWQYIAKMADVDQQSFALGLRYLSRNIEDVAQGTGDSLKYFKAMGIQVSDVSGNLRPLDNILREIAGKFSQWEEGPRKIAMALAIFGRGGEALVPLLNQGKKGIEGYWQEAEKLGIILSPDLIKKGSEAEELFKRLEVRWRAGRLEFAPLVLELGKWIEKIDEARRKSIGFISQQETKPTDIGRLLGIAGTPEQVRDLANQYGVAFEDFAERQSQYWIKLGAYEKTMEEYGAKKGPAPFVSKEEEKIFKMPADLWDYFKKAPGFIEIINDGVVQETLSVEQLNERLKTEFELKSQLMDLAPKLDRWELEAGYGPPAGYVRDVGGGLISMTDAVERNKVLEDFKNIQKSIIDSWEFEGAEPLGQISARKQAQQTFEKGKEMDIFWADTATRMGQSFTSGFFNIFTSGLKNAGDSFKQFGLNMLNSFTNVVQQMISNWLVFGSAIGSSGFTSGEKFGGLLGLINIFKAQEGFSGMVNRPTGFIAGEGGKREFVNIVPEGKMSGSSAGGQTINNIYYVNLNAIDTQNMDQALRKNSGSIVKIVKKNIDSNGPLRGR